jgi:hypothetical protein
MPKVPLKIREFLPLTDWTGNGVSDIGDPLMVISTLVEADSRPVLSVTS